MTDRTALLRAICEHPEDDGPRMIFADWLEDNGETERAEFVRVQIALARGASSGPLSLRNARLASIEFASKPNPLRSIRAAELLYRYATFWIGQPFFEVNIRTVDQEWGWSRGFLSHVACTWSEWQRLAPKLLWWGPRKCEKCRYGRVRQMVIPPFRSFMARPGELPQPIETIEEDCSACRGTGELPGATVACPKCFRGTCDDMDIGDITCNEWPCENCGGSVEKKRKGTGRIPAPFPDTAQPIETVTLTTTPQDWFGSQVDVFGAEAEAHCRRLWPTIRDWRLTEQYQTTDGRTVGVDRAAGRDWTARAVRG